MKTSAGYRCDVCAVIEAKHPLMKDGRPPADSRDRFFGFCIPATIDPATGKPKKGGFRGVGMQSDQRMPAPLDACPDCADKLKKALKFSIRKMVIVLDKFNRVTTDALQLEAIRDLSLLPNGPLRQALEPIKASGRLPTLQ